MKTIFLTAVTTLMANQALATGHVSTSAKCILDPNDPSCSTAVPEISALEGTAALAALAAIVLIAWERRRRAV